MISIAIQEVAGFPNPGVQLNCNDIHGDLGSPITVQATIVDVNGQTVYGPRRFALTAEQYAGWVGSDVYVADCVAQLWNLTTIAPSTAPQPPAPTQP